jgi:hypothetical protein
MQNVHLEHKQHIFANKKMLLKIKGSKEVSKLTLYDSPGPLNSAWHTQCMLSYHQQISACHNIRYEYSSVWQFL